ncbi:hypothetical protein CROQUDRAFT_666724 [Cronartium quercuum f. sp. fusiforme G11]|uniref:Uncharacterized protein n=1 Tax=Cronartium quercuum f. sp. fusiforme G11 TaxID=708437 RepID=A0A9P6N541_9BASI|nr:hypothetical protein CROQUDRAFT_666724 [Cronartium quercuum f. sp. fusiforme G11]
MCTRQRVGFGFSGLATNSITRAVVGLRKRKTDITGRARQRRLGPEEVRQRKRDRGKLGHGRQSIERTEEGKGRETDSPQGAKQREAVVNLATPRERASPTTPGGQGWGTFIGAG